MLFQLATRNVHHKRNQITPIGLLPRELRLLAPDSFCQNQISSFSTISSGTEGPAWNRHGTYTVLTLIVRLAGEDGPWLRQKLGISILIKTKPAAKLFSWQQYNRCHFVCLMMNIFGAKFEEHCFNISLIFPEIFFIPYFFIVA